jgi:hypothetical protein
MMKKSLAVIGILAFIILICSTASATSGIIFAKDGNGSADDYGFGIVDKDKFEIQMSEGSIYVNMVKYNAPCTLRMDSFFGRCVILNLKHDVYLRIFGFGRNIIIS